MKKIIIITLVAVLLTGCAAPAIQTEPSGESLLDLPEPGPSEPIEMGEMTELERLLSRDNIEKIAGTVVSVTERENPEGVNDLSAPVVMGKVIVIDTDSGEKAFIISGDTLHIDEVTEGDTIEGYYDINMPEIKISPPHYIAVAVYNLD